MKNPSPVFIDAEVAKTLSSQEVLNRLDVTEGGLSTDQVVLRLQQFGLNALAEHRVSPLVKFLGYFWGPIPWMIETAALLSALVQHWADFSIIVVLLLVNAVIGFYEEYKADNAIQLLKQKLALMARARRNGQWTTIPASQLLMIK
jgi:H+-transporting ATPase